jgi:hypothetical protein
MGPESMAMWQVTPGMEGWSSRLGAAAVAAGLHHRPREALLVDLLAWDANRASTDGARPD